MFKTSMSCMFSNQNAMKLEINCKKQIWKENKYKKDM